MHRLLCGDSTKAEDVKRVMNGERAVMIEADPPYNVGYSGGQGSQRLDSDFDERKDYADWLANALVICHTVSTPDATLHLWFAGSAVFNVVDALKRSHWVIRSLLFWNKLDAHYGAFYAQYKPRAEPFFYCHKVGERPKWYGPTNELTVWDEKQPHINQLHPVMKPVALYGRAFRNHSLRGDIVLDPFLGSGTAIIAGEQLGRRVYAIEIEPRYCEMAIRRWEDMTGQEARLVQS